MIGYAKMIGGEIGDFPSQVADLTNEAVALFDAASQGGAIVTDQGEPAVITAQGQTVAIDTKPASGFASLFSSPIVKWGALGLAAWYGYKTFVK